MRLYPPIAQAQEVVVLRDDLPGRAGEVDLEDRHVAAQVVDVEYQVVGELLAISPDDPADAQRSQPELVPRAADRLDPGETEVENHLRRAERREEGAAGPVHVNVDIKAGIGLQLVERMGHGLHRLVGAGVGDAEGGDDHDRVLVHPLKHRGWIHGVGAMGHRDLAHFDVPVAGELVPYHLDWAAYHVRLIRRLAFGLPLGPPAPLGRHARQHAGLRGSDGRGANGVSRPGACHRSASMCTQRASISAVCGYSSLSIMFLLTESAIRARSSGSAHVWQNVARFWRALPSSITSSDTTWNASLGSVSSRGNRYLGTGRVRLCPANTDSSSWSRTLSRSCKGMMGSPWSAPLIGRRRSSPPMLAGRAEDVITQDG